MLVLRNEVLYVYTMHALVIICIQVGNAFLAVISARLLRKRAVVLMSNGCTIIRGQATHIKHGYGDVVNSNRQPTHMVMSSK